MSGAQQTSCGARATTCSPIALTDPRIQDRVCCEICRPGEARQRGLHRVEKIFLYYCKQLLEMAVCIDYRMTEPRAQLRRVANCMHACY